MLVTRSPFTVIPAQAGIPRLAARDSRFRGNDMILGIVIALTLAGCTPQERNRLPQPQDGNGTVIDLRNDGYFERLNTSDSDKAE